MRPALPAFVLSLLLLNGPVFAVSGAHAAPTCLNRQGETVRCGTPNALPLGVRLPQEAPRQTAAGPGVRKLIGLAAFLAGLFALILLLPDFQGRWDGQETDDEARD